MEENDNNPKTITGLKTLLHDSFIKFLRTHTVYETVPENMKVREFITK
jgi:hypothetical protein